MITKEQLNSIGFSTKDNVEYYDAFTFDFMFNIKQQKLYSHCEVSGDVELLCIVKDLEQLKEVCYLTTGITFEES